MKKPLLLIAALAASSLGFAQEVGRVISSTPVLQQVGVPRQICSTEQVQVRGQHAGSGAVLGAVAGGVIGNAIGDGSSRALTTVVGAVGGAILGDRIQGNASRQVQNVQRCSTQTFYENRAVAYNVVYSYAGKRYQTQMPYNPGPGLRLNVNRIGPVTRSHSVVYEQPVLLVRQAPVVLIPRVRGPYDNRVLRQPTPVMVAQVDRRDVRWNNKRDDWQNNRRDWRDGR